MTKKTQKKNFEYYTNPKFTLPIILIIVIIWTIYANWDTFIFNPDYCSQSDIDEGLCECVESKCMVEDDMTKVYYKTTGTCLFVLDSTREEIVLRVGERKEVEDSEGKIDIFSNECLEWKKKNPCQRFKKPKE